MSYELAFRKYGESALLIDWPQKIDEHLSDDVISFQVFINKLESTVIKNTILSYASLLVFFDNQETSFDTLKSELKLLYQKSSITSNESTLWHIPVCYDLSFGLDLSQMALSKNCSIHEIVQAHCFRSFRVYFIGFLPGFLYLGGLQKSLHSPRKNEPRLIIPSGSVGIGGEQTGIYPMESPGGWNIIGRTPISFFDEQLSVPCFAKPGDQIKFYAIEMDTYEDIASKAKIGDFQLKGEVI